MRTLKEGGFEEVVLVGNEEQVGNDVLNQIKACSNAAISRLEDRSPFALANRAFEIAKSDFKESDTAVLTWPGCTGDLLSLAPYSNANKCPLFFHEDNGVINDETLSILTKNQFKRVLILGGQESFPDACLEPLLSANIEIIRFCGKDPYDANWDINRWIDEQSGTQRNELIVSSVWDPSDAFGISSYAAENNAMILLSDPQNLDSINNAFNFIEQHGKSIKKITFLGNHTRFNETDRSLIEKAHAKAQSSYKDYRENK